MTIRKDYPRQITVMRDVFIPLKDGTRLAAQIWLPVDADKDPVPAILEYLPYRKRDGTSERDAVTHPYYAGFGYAGVRVDIRGTGDSEGILYDEYSKQEQDDGLEVIAWLAKQKWCSGAVGMIGISWGGFNGLQIAARRPKALKAVVTLCSTDDRYADDIHAMGGTLLVDKVSWGATMFSILTTPPDPALVGDKWRQMWLDRMGDHALWLLDWHEHLRRDSFFEHGSVCENYRAIKCPVYAVGGWADGYSNAVFRLLKGLKVPRKGLVGPWAHKYPHFAKPGPQIGFLQETLRWWDKWLKGIETGIMDEPMLRVWMQDPVPPRRYYETRPGRWVAEDVWPSKRIKPKRMAFGHGTLGGKAGKGVLSISSPETVGQTAGRFCPYGLEPDLPDDQRIEAGGSLVFDSPVLEEDAEMLGAAIVQLEVSADKPNAKVVAVLSEVLPDGAVTRVSYGVLNLTHRNGHAAPEAIRPGEVMRVTVRLNETAHRFAKGNRIRMALSTAYWPIIWPSPETATLSVHLDRSRLEIPARPSRPEDKELAPFLPRESSPPLRQTVLRDGYSHWSIEQDFATGVMDHKRDTDDGERRIEEIDWTVGSRSRRSNAINPHDPLSARSSYWNEKTYKRGDLSLRIVTGVDMCAELEHFVIEGRLEAYEGEREVIRREWKKKVPRDYV
ncbi:MAG: CocE/NonD family hydrolase [Hyphomicrobiaceae bacterium]